MKELLKDGFRFIIISIELVIGLLITAIYFYWPHVFRPVGALLTSKEDMKIVISLISLPLAGIIYGYKLAKELMAPQEADSSLKKTFNTWPGFPKLRNRVFYVIGLCIISFMVNIALWLTSDKIEADLVGFLYTLVNSFWFVGILSLAIANLTLKAILGGRR